MPLRLHHYRRRGRSGEDHDLSLQGCQTGTGSAFRVSVPVAGATFRISGQPTTYLKTTAESGNPRAQAFCPRCGSPIYSTTPGEGAQPSYMVRVGILRQRNELVPRRQIWFLSAQPWV